MKPRIQSDVQRCDGCVFWNARPTTMGCIPNPEDFIEGVCLNPDNSFRNQHGEITHRRVTRAKESLQCFTAIRPTGEPPDTGAKNG